MYCNNFEIQESRVEGNTEPMDVDAVQPETSDSVTALPVIQPTCSSNQDVSMQEQQVV